MIAEVMLGTTLLCCAGTAVYFYRDHERSKLARERERREVEEQEARERAAERAGFRRELVRALRTTPADRFEFEPLAEQCGLPPEEASLAARELLAELVRRALEDGVVTDREREKVETVARLLRIGPDEVGVLIRTQGRERYREAVAATLDDGIVSEVEAEELERLRASVGLPRAEAFALSSDLSADAYFDLIRRTARTGGPSEQLGAYIESFRRAFGAVSGDFSGLLGKRLLNLHRELVSEIIQDGEVTEGEERVLEWLRREGGIAPAVVAQDLQRLAQAKRLAAYRRGELPAVPTAKLLEGGETCHFDAPCLHTYETRTKVMEAGGELVVTSKRVIFVSATKSFEFSPAKIVDLGFVGRHGRALEIKTSTSRGTGVYQVDDAVTLEAVLCGVVRKHKYLLSQNYASERSRHIPGDVKRAVWDRDGGRCVQCGADDYLEFDHIIPHARGGSNSEKNVQLLCRRCNGEKSDRI